MVFLWFFNVFCKSDISKKNSNVWPSWSGLGASWVALGPSWDRLGAVLGRLWAVLGIFGTLLGPHRRYDCDLESAAALVWGGPPPQGLLVNKFTSELVNKFSSEYIEVNSNLCIVK